MPELLKLDQIGILIDPGGVVEVTITVSITIAVPRQRGLFISHI